MQRLLKIQTDELSVSKSGAVTAPIYFHIEDQFFPEEGWSDFPLIILSWWLDEIAGLAEKQVFEFMDGPFKIKTLRIGSDLQLEGVWRRKAGDKVVFSKLVPEHRLVASFHAEAAALLSSLKGICPDHSDFKELQSKLT
jgi:hypothetical protein